MLFCISTSVYYYQAGRKDDSEVIDELSKLAGRIVQERERNGQYRSLEDFHHRTGAGLEQIIILIRIGAFRFLNENKKELLWEAHLLLNKKKRLPQGNALLFPPPSGKKPLLPPLHTDILEDVYDEIELMGFPISDTLFSMARSEYRGEVSADDLVNYAGKSLRLVAHLVTWKTVRTKHKAIMKFGTFLDSNGEFIDTVHFPQSLRKYPLRGKGLYLLEGKCVVEHGCATLEVHRCALMPVKADPRSV